MKHSVVLIEPFVEHFTNRIPTRQKQIFHKMGSSRECHITLPSTGENARERS